MDKKIIDWLLGGPSWLKYAVELQLLDSKPDIKAALSDSQIVIITHRLRDSKVGIPALLTGKITCKETGNAYWDLFFLADIGLTAGDLNLNQDMDNILNCQSSDNTYSFYPGMVRDYFCYSAIPLATIAKMGYRDDPRVKRYIQSVWNAQCPDGGWHCEGWGDTGCPMDNLNVLMLLGQYKQYQNEPALNSAINLLLEHWERRAEKWHKDGFGVGHRFQSLEYPTIKYGILRVLDVLSLSPSAIKSPGFQSMLNLVRKKSIDGKYFAESTSEAYTYFDFGQKKEPSRWLTFLINRIEKRVRETG